MCKNYYDLFGMIMTEKDWIKYHNNNIVDYTITVLICELLNYFKKQHVKKTVGKNSRYE